MEKYNRKPKLRSVTRMRSKKMDRKRDVRLNEGYSSTVSGTTTQTAAKGSPLNYFRNTGLSERTGLGFSIVIDAVALALIVMLIVSFTRGSNSDDNAVEAPIVAVDEIPAVVEEVPESVIADESAEAAIPPVIATIEEAEPAADIVAVETVPDTVLGSLVYSGRSAGVTSYPDHTEIAYPDIVSADEAEAFLAFSSERNGVDVPYSAAGGVATIIHPYSLSDSERETAIAVLQSDLDAYMASLMAEESVAVPVISEVEEPVEASVAEAEEVSTVIEDPSEETVVEIGEIPVISETVEEALSVLPPVIQTVAEEEDDEWKEIKHSLSFSVSPYSFKYVDFYHGRGNTSISGIPASEFMSEYGFGFSLVYTYNIIPYLSVGLETGFYGYDPLRSILSDDAFYMQVPVLATMTGILPIGNVSLFLGGAIGVDFSFLEDVYGYYLMCGVHMGVSWRFAEDWSFFWKAEGTFTYQPKYDDSMYSSKTYALHPVSLGISCHF